MNWRPPRYAGGRQLAVAGYGTARDEAEAKAVLETAWRKFLREAGLHENSGEAA
jgi:hypothetical protein